MADIGCRRKYRVLTGEGVPRREAMSTSADSDWTVTPSASSAVNSALLRSPGLWPLARRMALAKNAWRTLPEWGGLRQHYPR